MGGHQLPKHTVDLMTCCSHTVDSMTCCSQTANNFDQLLLNGTLGLSTDLMVYVTAEFRLLQLVCF